MTVIAKFPISTGNGKGGKIVVPKGTRGSCKAISNSPKIKEAFPNMQHKPDGWFFIVSFPDYIDEILCDPSQLELDATLKPC